MPGPKSDKKWADALSRALHRESNGKGSPQWLEVIADRCVQAAADGDIQAIREVGDRMDGKPKQQTEISGPGGDSIPVAINVQWK
jgi:hypothetical protein